MFTLAQIATFLEFKPSLIINIVMILILLFASALASGSETSLFSLSPSDLNKIKNRSSRSDNAILKLLSIQDYLLATVLIVNNLVNICMIILCTSTIDSFVEFNSVGWEFGIKSIAVLFILLLFGEIMPKIFANYNPIGFASFIAVPLLGLKTLFKPLSFVLVKYSSRMRNKRSKKSENISIDELSNALEITESQSKEEKEMLSGIVSFVNTEVEDIMKPRMDIKALNIEDSFDVVKQTIIDSGFSRIPVYRDSIDTIEGVLYVKDILQYINEADDFEWTKHLRKTYYTPEGKKINDLLDEFQTNKVHIAIVVDEYGSTLGLVSLEDIIEEIVGEISDESDVEDKSFYKKIDENTFIFDGKTHICDLERVIELPEDIFNDVKGDAETLAGMMLEIKKDFLRKDDRLTIKEIHFTVLSMEGRRVNEIRVERPNVTGDNETH